MGRKRPERKASEWANVRAATDWYMTRCASDGMEREAALLEWEERSIASRIRYWRLCVKLKSDPGVQLLLAERPAPRVSLRKPGGMVIGMGPT